MRSNYILDILGLALAATASPVSWVVHTLVVVGGAEDTAAGAAVGEDIDGAMAEDGIVFPLYPASSSEIFQ
ncbi:hypothetical protein N7517_003947 [Penicillium concentricum]|uniref:Uncharacterized protein n=1 Tax=Penicillium concentricum TaxID=293559 RepID=A0A9W9S4N5_9EURO|nr:uncharacterized protein N7517_003947 [Penicillium concentricum]KAJ5371941.1 hypothetical protein N7517_003947 [Penicillium concentricum]